MNWAKDETGQLPVWAGKEQKRNPAYNIGITIAFPMVGSLFLLLALFLSSFDSNPREEFLNSVNSFMMIVTVAGGLILIFIPLLTSAKFKGDSWRLSATPDGLEYHKGGALIWSAAYHRIARVESGPTIEWEAARQGAIGASAVSRAEYQTAIFTDSMARLVVQSVEQGREECLRLSVDLKSFLDARAASLSAAPDLGGTSRAANSSTGFDI